MKLVCMVLVISLSCWTFFSAWRGLAGSRPGWKIAFGVATLAGLALGIRLVTYTYLKSPTVQPYGYPFDFGGAEFFDGWWHGGLISPYMLPAILADAALGLVVLVGPFRMAQALAGTLRRSNEAKQQSG